MNLHPLFRRRRGAAVAALGLLLGACASTPPGGLSTVEGRPVAFDLRGEGTPAIVLQSGLGDGHESWSALMPELAASHAVLAFDRPGYGHSAAAATPRSPCQIATETRELLRAAGLKPPYVMVGHSLGGLYQYVYARLYPDEVASLVLLDPTHPKHLETLEHEAPSAARTLRLVRRTLFGATPAAEFDHMRDCLDRIDAAQPLPMPVRILVSTRFAGIEDAQFQQALWPLREDWRRLTGAGPLQRVDTRHYIHKEAPALVATVLGEAASQAVFTSPIGSRHRAP